MDDVSKIQQVNNLARELMKHGQASSMDEAIKKAQDQVESGPAMPAAPMPEAPSPETNVQEENQGAEQPQSEQPQQSQGEQPQNQEPAPAPEPIPEVPQETEKPAQDAGVDEKISAMQGILDRQQSALSAVTGTINHHQKGFEEMNNKINGLIGEITTLKQAVEKLSNSPVTPPLKPKQADAGQTQFKPESAPAPAPAPEPEQKPEGGGHARTGNFNSDDVSIEKFFYYGQR